MIEDNKVDKAIEAYQAGFVATREETSTQIPDSVVRLTQRVHDLINKYREVEGLSGVKTMKVARNVDEVVSSKPAWSPETGVSGNGEVMSTLRDGAEKAFDAPKIKALVGQTREVDGQQLRGSCVEISANFSNGSTFANEVLPGVQTVRVWDNGFVESYSSGKSTALTTEQAEQLTTRFDAIIGRANNVITRMQTNSQSEV